MHERSGGLGARSVLHGHVSFAEVVQERAARTPDRLAFTFLDANGDEEERVTYRQLDDRAARIGARLAAERQRGSNVLLLYPPGIEYIAGFLGCLYAGCAAVPAYPPRNPRQLARIGLVVSDAEAKVALTSRALLPRLRGAAVGLEGVKLLATDDGASAPPRLERSDASRDSLAFLQYTSGSTGNPKGVMVTHGNLLENSARMVPAFGLSADTTHVIWLPPYHDMGLIGGILQPIYTGFPCVLMAPTSFVQQPLRWLEAITRYRGTCSGGPNFAYELCVDRVSDEQLRTLDLSTWQVAFNGAEPVRAGTLRRFCDRFAPCGFRPEAFFPCYGLAEATLLVSTAGHRESGLRPSRRRDGAAADSKADRDLDLDVSCGVGIAGQDLIVVDPATREPTPPGSEGELWLSGPSVARGYWRKEAETEATFRARLHGSGKGPFLRTGDLGYVENGELYVTGRIKDVVNLAGRKLHPQDIELSVERAHPALRKSFVAAFSVPEHGREKLVVVQEVEPRYAGDPAHAIGPIREALAADHDVLDVTVVLAKAGSVPKTTSGKVRRGACRKAFLEGTLEVTAQSKTPTEEAIGALFRDLLQVDRVAPGDDFFQLGGQSLLATQLASRVRTELGVDLPVTALFEEPTVAGLVASIEEQRAAARAGPEARIPRAPRGGDVPLSFAQERLWFLAQLEPDNPFYNVSGAIRLRGRLDVASLRETLNEIVRRHESLRTTFTTRGGRPIQVVAPALRLDLPLLDLAGLAPGERDARSRAEAGAQARAPFDLERGPLVRAKVVRLAEEEHVVLLTLHHVVSDGWSVGVLVGEWATLYAAFAEGRPSPLAELPIQYADFAAWHRNWLEGDRLARQLAYWKQKLEGRAALDLPLDRPRPPAQSFRGATHRFVLSAELRAALSRLGRERGATLFMTLLAGFKALLHRTSGSADVCVGSPIANRNRKELEPLIGFFVNMLVLRTDLSGEPSFEELLSRVRETALGAYQHQDLPFERLVEELQPGRDLSQAPLFQVAFVLQQAPARGLRAGRLELERFATDNATAKYDLTLQVEEDGDALACALEYSTDLFESGTIARLAECFGRLLESAARDPCRPIGDLEMLSGAERAEALGNATAAPWPRSSTVVDLFEAHAARRPDAPAVVFGDLRLTYAELNARANRLARRLADEGVGPETVVGLCAERSLEMVVGVLGILKAGGAYVPLDPGYPRERLAFMLDDSRAAVLVAQRRLVTELPEHPRLVALDDDLAAFDGTNLPLRAGPEHLAYVVYTSGSTGRPKGALNTHAGLCNLATAGAAQFGIDSSHRLLQVASFSFDASVWEMATAFAQGAALHLVARDTLLSPRDLVAAIEEQGVTTALFAPSLLATLPVERLAGMHTLVVGGEACPRELPARFAPVRRFFNAYGPSEAAVVSSLYRASGDEPGAPPIGRPLANARLYVLDDRLQPVGTGVAGELYVGGDGVGRGYLGRPGLTAERFVPDPFGADPGARLYRTGDRVRQRTDGNVEFLGRLDHQVKMRGFRIEPGEIEAALSQHEAVRDAVVTAREDAPGQKRLVAYYVARRPTAPRAPGAASEQVKIWESIFSEVYRAPGGERDPSLDFSGWHSSYTGKAIPETEMREWVERTVARILDLRPRRVLEIGCGTGLLLHRIAPHCDEYVGTDLSAGSLRTVASAAAQKGLRNVHLLHCPADDLRAVGERRFDIAVLNSVVQYFPDTDYLLAVLDGLLPRLARRAQIFLGDVRNLALLDAYYWDVFRSKRGTSATPAEARRNLERNRLAERELVVDPALFLELRRKHPRIGQVELLHKRGRGRNELTKFRYDAVLHLDSAGLPPSRSVEWSAFRDHASPTAWLEEKLADPRAAAFGVRGVPNLRSERPARAARLLRSAGCPQTASAFEEELDRTAPAAVDPEELCELGEARGWKAQIGWAATEPDLAMDVLFQRKADAPIALPASEADPGDGRGLETLANDPAWSARSEALPGELREFLEARLPDYMVPSTFVALERLPLTPGGKIDRNALPAPDGERRDLAFVPPRSPVEEALAAIWADVLSVARVGVRDNFFDLGGHSLLATQLASRVRDALGAELPVRALFENPTIAEIAAILETQRRGAEAPIARAPRTGTLRPSFAQERLWFLDQLEPGNTAYHIPVAVHLGGALDADALRRALAEIVARHEVLRTSFASGEDGPSQRITGKLDLDLPVLDLGGLAGPEQKGRVSAELSREAALPFDIARGPLLRARLLRLGDEEHLALFTMHHVVSDGWSMGVFVRELAALYQAFRDGRPSPLPELGIQYADFAEWQRKWLTDERLEGQLSYWKEKLAAPRATVELPADRPRPAVQTYRGAHHRFSLPPALTEELRRFGRERGATLFMILLAGFEALLHRYTGQTDVSVGTPVANRNRKELEDLIGFFVNTLVLRTDLAGDPTFDELVGRVRETALGAYANQDAPFERLVDELQPARDLSHTPLFQVLFALRNAPVGDLQMADLDCSLVEAETGTAKFDLSVEAWEAADGLACSIEYNVDLFERTTVERLGEHFALLLTSALADPAQRVGELPILTAKERGDLAAWNATARPYPRELTVVDLFEEKVAHHPTRTAVADDDRRMTYGELGERTEKLARALRAKGIGPESLVAICAERSLEMVVGILGVLRAGAAYLPLDPEHPRERLAFLLDDSCPAVLLTQERFVEALPPTAATVWCLDGDQAQLSASGDFSLAGLARPESLAYCIYTSGSTGRPKATGNTHAGLLNRLLWMQDEYRLGRDDRVLQKTPFGFDVSVWEFLWPLVTGARLVMAAPGIHRDPRLLRETMERHGITTVHFVPSMLQAFVGAGELQGHCPALRQVMCSGEALSYELQRAFLAQHSAWLHNLYGPTEASIDVSAWECREDSGRSVPIGRPIANIQLHVLDGQLQLAPVGAVGELHIGGVGLGRGYLRRPALTAERFVPDPFGPPGARLYRTGDLARFRSDGALDYLGRIDHQVKVRGFRIELGEVESALAQHRAVREVVVVAREDQARSKHLVAYYVPAGEVAPGELRAFLAERLPDYMVPAAFVALEALPLSANGKIDRNALPAPEASRTAKTAYVAPRTPSEETLAAIWAGVLGLDRVSVQDNFFELGGDSILSIQVVSRAQKLGLELTPKQLFEHQTVEALAVAAGVVAHGSVAEQGLVTGPLPLTPIQAWFFEQEIDEPHHFNQSVLLEVEPAFRADLLQPALDLLLRHHDALRLRFHRGEGWTEEIAEGETHDLVDLIDLAVLDPSERRRALEEHADAIQRSLDLASGPLVRAAHFDHGPDAPGKLLLVVHHLAVDGVSWRVIVEDLASVHAALARGEPPALPAKTSSFKEWAERLHVFAGSSELRSELDYWTSAFAESPAPLPVDHPGGENRAGSAREVTVSLSAEETHNLLQEAPAAYRTQVNDVLLTALATALSRWTGAERVLVDLEGHGREDLFEGMDLSRTVGWFTSLFPVALERDESGPGEALKSVKEQLRRVPGRGIGYGVLRYLSPDTEVSRALRALPCPQVSFNYLGQIDAALAAGPFRLTHEATGASHGERGRRAHLLDVVAVVQQGKLHVSCTYGREVHEKSTIDTFARSFLDELRSLVEHCVSGEAFGYTPSDFPLAHVDQATLDRLLGDQDHIG